MTGHHLTGPLCERRGYLGTTAAFARLEVWKHTFFRVSLEYLDARWGIHPISFSKFPVYHLIMNITKTETKDPICGMTVNETSALHTSRAGKTFYFCSSPCREKFLSTTDGAEPEGESGCCCK